MKQNLGWSPLWGEILQENYCCNGNGTSEKKECKQSCSVEKRKKHDEDRKSWWKRKVHELIAFSRLESGSRAGSPSRTCVTKKTFVFIFFSHVLGFKERKNMLSWIMSDEISGEVTSRNDRLSSLSVRNGNGSVPGNGKMMKMKKVAGNNNMVVESELRRVTTLRGPTSQERPTKEKHGCCDRLEKNLQHLGKG